MLAPHSSRELSMGRAVPAVPARPLGRENAVQAVPALPAKMLCQLCRERATEGTVHKINDKMCRTASVCVCVCASEDPVPAVPRRRCAGCAGEDAVPAVPRASHGSNSTKYQRYNVQNCICLCVCVCVPAKTLCQRRICVCEYAFPSVSSVPAKTLPPLF